MPEQERMEIIKAIKYVDQVFLCVDKDKSVGESLKAIAKMHPGAELFFAKGGDRNVDNIPEVAVCRKYGIKIVDGLGKKIRSSSILIAKASKKKRYAGKN